MAVILVVTGILSENAMAKNFYKASVSLKLTYSNAFQKTQTLESKRAHVVLSDDSMNYNEYGTFCQLKIDSKIYLCQGRFNSKKSYVFSLNEETLKQILQTHFNLSTSTILSMNLTSGYSITRSWSGYDGTDRVTKLQFHTDKNEESYHLIATARKAHLQ